MKRDINDYFREITQNMYTQVENKLSKYGIVKGQAQLLLLIKDNDGCSQKELANYFNIKYSSMSQRLSRLEDLGYITRMHEDNNFKYNKIYITKEGKQAAIQCRRILNDIEKSVFKGLSKKDLTMFENMLVSMIENLENV